MNIVMVIVSNQFQMSNILLIILTILLATYFTDLSTKCIGKQRHFYRPYQ